MSIFRRLFLTALALGSLGIAAPASMAQDDQINGLWLTENHRSVIRIAPCDQGVCGYIHWIVPGGMQKDSKNPDPALRSEPMCGLPILWGFKQQDASHWTDGRIYKADDGDTYKSNMQLLPSGKLVVRGYVGMPLLGKSQTWVKVDEADYPKCQ